ncbi:hypothetical protein ACLB1N_19880 [Escherichia coli]
MHKDGLALNTVINGGADRYLGGAVGNTTINQNGELRVHAGGEATAVARTRAVHWYRYCGNCHRHKPSGNSPWEMAWPSHSSGKMAVALDVLEGHSAQKTRWCRGGTLAVSAGGKATV